jgi:hydroxymethylpyrimidine/phosphomethylpyrimidine kinase
MSAVTTVTVQNTVEVSDAIALAPEFVAAQIAAVASDIRVDAVKTGILPNRGIIDAVAHACDEAGVGRSRRTPFVVDPVAATRLGVQLLDDDALDALRHQLFPRATLVTPNLDEVRLLTGIDVQSRDQLADAARAVHAFGAEWTLIKGGHLTHDSECVDLLYDGTSFLELAGPRYPTTDTHGAGDTMAAAIASSLAKGSGLIEAVQYGKRFVSHAVRDAYGLGAGPGPVSPFWRLQGEPD